ncbi:MAG: hypothetical protein PHR06_11260 [Candidatus Cloacimonetes bacterium]|nr:hypothetical protein [Candidatus Cloacimonadota bacterium]
MKKSLLFCTILCLLSNFLTAKKIYSPNSIDSNSNSYDGMFQFDFRNYYNYFLTDEIYFEYELESRLGQNTKYARKEKKIANKWTFGNQSHNHYESIILNHNYLSDKASGYTSLNSETSEKRFGFFLGLGKESNGFLNSNSMFSFISRDENKHNANDENGYEFSHHITLGQLPINNYSLSAYYKKTSLKYWQNTYEINGNIDKPFTDNNISLKTAYKRNERNVALMQGTDDTKITEDDYSGYFEGLFYLPAGINLTLSQNVIFLKKDYEKDHQKTSSELSEWTSLNTVYPLNNNFTLTGYGFHSFRRRYDMESTGDKDDTKSTIRAGINFYFRDSIKDSLIFQRETSLEQTTSSLNNLLDRDILFDNYKLSLYTFLNRRTHLITHLIYSTRDNIELSSSTSATNSTITGYHIQPQLEIVLGDRVMIKQLYHIKAEYTDFHYNLDANMNDLFLRHFNAEYRWVYDSSPYIRKNNTYKWLHLSGREKSKNPYSIEVVYSTTHSNTGMLSDGKYKITSETRFHTFWIDFSKSLDSLILRARPKVIWSSKREYNVLIGAEYMFGRENFASFILIPSWKRPDDISWKWNDNFPFLPERIKGLDNILWKIEFNLSFRF